MKEEEEAAAEDDSLDLVGMVGPLWLSSSSSW